MKDIQGQLISGVFFTALAKYANLIISLVVTAILARLLAPDQFGVVAIATVAIAFLNLIADIGLSATVIQHKELDRKALSALFSLSVYITLLLSLIFFLCAGVFANWYDQPELRPICQWLALSLLFSGITVVPNALFYRDRLFKAIALRSLVIQLVGGAMSVVAAYQGYGVYALIINPIFSSILIFGISYAKFPLKFTFSFSLQALRPIFSYSFYQFLFNIINYFSRNADTLLIGKYLGMVPLGYYDKSYRLMSLPLQNITQVITPVIHPILSLHSKDLGYLNRVNLKLVSFLALIGFPLAIFLYFSSEELILLFFGPQWELAIPTFKILSLTVGIQLVLSSSGSIFQTAGDTRSLFICGLFSAVVNVTGILLGVFYFKSIEAVAQCLLVTFAINFVQTYWLMYMVIFKASIVPFLTCLWKPVLFAGILAGLLYSADLIFNCNQQLYSFLFKSLVFVPSFALLVWFGGYQADIKQFINRKRGNN
ncbi:lipopolysaccharide biosynthesis protein [Sphingobacterium sp. PCS056]|uniref:lipopolysaccharide biosynthesis protein n=1 Tax=Sphingobacterium sp. PCS056 TaxID=2931400 RepID=UPI00200C9F8D|nr:lipopolysaccharide biosynthesis protein [Sphingobacterium sp. PCS056]UPZ37801.1 lipopolysaccharide biosynthesis protein [Sphingobacterium sp. PCS056]